MAPFVAASQVPGAVRRLKPLRVVRPSMAPDPVDRANGEDQLDQEEYVCEICGRAFESEADLEDHVHDEGQLT